MSWFRIIWVLLLLAVPVLSRPAQAPAQSAPWPNRFARYKVMAIKTAGMEMTDQLWVHLHHGTAEAEQATLSVWIVDDVNVLPNANFTQIQLRWLVHGVPISPWLGAPFDFVLQTTNPALDGLPDGIHDISVEVQGTNMNDFVPSPMQLHLYRGRHPASTLVPMTERDCIYCNYDAALPILYGPGAAYIDTTTLKDVGYPVDPMVTPWHRPPYDEDLYQEEMAPHGNLFAAMQMRWREPVNTVSAGHVFIRAFPPKFEEDHRTLWHYPLFRGTNADFGFAGHKSFPFKDGPRGVAWTSPYVTGSVDSQGGFAFVEAGGPLRYMKPDGEVITVAGWRVAPGTDPVWYLKPLNSIRQNMELRGTWINGQYPVPEDRGFHGPFDVTIDQRNENVWYVAGFHDNVIWKVVVDRSTYVGTVSVLAGDPNHAPGFADGVGTAARFDGPMSLVFDPVTLSLYVSDQTNDSIRRVNPDTGQVTTIFGRPGMGQRLFEKGLPRWDGEEGCIASPAPMQCYDANKNRTVANFEVSAAQAATGMRPDIYVPMTVRVDSLGNLVVFDIGFASIRKINPATGETKLLEGFIADRFSRDLIGWVWLDVDRWGNSGPRDGVYWMMSVGGQVIGEDPSNRHFNELFAWIPKDGGASKWVTGPDFDPFPDGWGQRAATDVPHYPWNVAIDPRGAIYLSGIGEHGITRLRKRRANDPVPTNYFQYEKGEELWTAGQTVGGIGLALRNGGWEGHNMVGLPDAWGQVGKTDEELITIFGIPDSIRNIPADLQAVLAFIRLNSGPGR